MAEYRIKRTGQTALKFAGEQIASVGGPIHAGQEASRWYDLAVYRTAAGALVVAASYETRWQGESDQYAAEVIESGDLAQVPPVFSELQAELDCKTAQYGYPRGDQFVEKQARMLAQLQALWASRVSAILDELDIAETIN